MQNKAIKPPTLPGDKFLCSSSDEVIETVQIGVPSRIIYYRKFDKNGKTIVNMNAMYFRDLEQLLKFKMIEKMP